MKISQTLQRIAVPVLSVLLGLILGGSIMLAFSYNPIEGYRALINGSLGNNFYIGETLRQATPLILVALGFSVAINAGFFNIGVAGQFIMGWLTLVVTAMFFPELPSFLSSLLALLAGFLGGAVWGGIAGLFRAYFGASEVISTIMLNYMALYATNHKIRNVLTDGADSTPRIAPNASLRMEALTELTDYSTIHLGIFLAIILCLVIWILMKKTTIGFELRVMGFNPDAAEYAGMSAKKNAILALFISGGLAGLGGAMDGLGTFQNLFVLASVPQTGFDGIAVALLGNGQPFGILLAGLLFGVLKIGAVSMPMVAGVPSEIVDIVIAAIIFFVGSNYLIRYVITKRKNQLNKKNDLLQVNQTELANKEEGGQ